MLPNDTAAIKEIAKQLVTRNTTGIAHTKGVNSSSLTANWSMITTALKERKLAGVAVFFLLNRFEEFAIRRKQTLLYDLFDLTQCCDVCIGVVGMSHRVDVMDMLEKRVKSRFSCKQLLFMLPTFKDVREIVDRFMVLSPPTTTTTTSSSSTTTTTRATVDSSGCCCCCNQRVSDCSCYNNHNNNWTQFSRSNNFINLLRNSHDNGNPTVWFQRLCSFANIIRCSDNVSVTSPFVLQHFVDAVEMLSPDRNMLLLRQVNELEGLLLVCVCKLQQQQNNNNKNINKNKSNNITNFEQVLQKHADLLNADEYAALSVKLRADRAVLFMWWQHLIELGLLLVEGSQVSLCRAGNWCLVVVVVVVVVVVLFRYMCCR